MEMVTISKNQLEGLEKDREKLRALEAAGVDNWDGYSRAMRVVEKDPETCVCRGLCQVMNCPNWKEA